MKQPTLRQLLLASYSCIFIQTTDFEGAEILVRDEVAKLNAEKIRYRDDDTPVITQFSVWKLTTGVTAYKLNNMVGDDIEIIKTPIGETTPSVPLIKALEQCVKYEDSLVTVFHHPRTLITSALTHNLNVQLVLDAALAGREKSSCLVFIGASWEIPQELENVVYRYDYPLPDRKQLVDICLDKVVFPNIQDLKFLDLPEKKRDWLSKSKIYDLNKDLLDSVARAASGLDPLAAENAFALSLTTQGSLDVELIQDQKKAVIKKSGALEFFPIEETMNTVGGFSRYKDWIGRRKGAFTKEAEDFGVTPPKGVLLLGIPGTGKSLCGKATAAGLGIPLVRFDISRVKGKYVGDSETGMRTALQVIDAIDSCVLWVDKPFVHVKECEFGETPNS